MMCVVYIMACLVYSVMCMYVCVCARCLSMIETVVTELWKVGHRMCICIAFTIRMIFFCKQCHFLFPFLQQLHFEFKKEPNSVSVTILKVSVTKKSSLLSRIREMYPLKEPLLRRSILFCCLFSICFE